MDISSCAINNGFTTYLFSIYHGVPQGVSLSPLLFVLALQILTCQIKQDHNIRGIIINNEEIKVTAFAGDMTRFLKDISNLTFLCVSKYFQNILV